MQNESAKLKRLINGDNNNNNNNNNNNKNKNSNVPLMVKPGCQFALVKYLK